jgi:hypothetical protein
MYEMKELKDSLNNRTFASISQRISSGIPWFINNLNISPSTVNFCNRIWRQSGKILFQFFKSGVHFQMRIGEEMQRKEKEQRIAQIYTQISVIMGN